MQSRFLFAGFGRGLCVAPVAMLLAFASPASADPASNVPLKTVTVDQFQAAEAVGGSVTAEGMTAMLIDALTRDGHFVVVERASGLASVQGEQALGTSNAANAETAAKTGQLIGASVIIRGAVIKYEAAASGTSVGVGGFGLGSFLAPQAGVKHQNSKLELAIRLVDATTGQVVGSFTAEGNAGANSASIDLVNRNTGLSAGLSTFLNTPIGQAAQDAMEKCIQKIVAGMTAVPWSSSIVEASADKIYVSGGADRHMTAGMTLDVIRKGKVFTDPSTGRVLDVEMEKVATIKVANVRDKMSIATLVDGQMPARGDIVRLP